MALEKKIAKMMAEVIRDIIKDPKNQTSIATFCQEYHLDRNNLTPKRFFSMTNRTLFRIMLGIAQLVSLEDFVDMCIRIAHITYGVASMEDGSPEAIKQSHAGSPIGKKKAS